jgi:hypothetical protein
MTEGEWLACSVPLPMLQFVAGKASNRKLRLFACACCRHIWHLLTDERSRRAVEVGERFADGEAGAQELEDAFRLACIVHEVGEEEARGAITRVTGSDGGELTAFVGAVVAFTGTAVGWAVAPNAPWYADPDDPASVRSHAARKGEAEAQARLLRCVFGNPFGPVVLDESWLAWNGELVVRLAQSIYDERDFDRLPILADALEDAGCTSEDLLRHLREPGEHARGCWALDVVRSVD